MTIRAVSVSRSLPAGEQLDVLESDVHKGQESGVWEGEGSHLGSSRVTTISQQIILSFGEASRGGLRTDRTDAKPP